MKKMDDILQEVARDEKYDKKTLDLVWKALLGHTKNLVTKTDECTIMFPHLGTAHVKTSHLVKKKTRPSTEEKFQRIREVIEHNKKHKQRYCLHRVLPKILRNYYTKGKELREIERIQNERVKNF